MEHHPISTHSFIFRIWRGSSLSSCWIGWVMHTRSRKGRYVSSTAELIAFIEERIGEFERTDSNSPLSPSKLK